MFEFCLSSHIRKTISKRHQTGGASKFFSMYASLGIASKQLVIQNAYALRRLSCAWSRCWVSVSM